MTGLPGVLAASRRRVQPLTLISTFDTGVDGWSINTGDFPSAVVTQVTSDQHDGAGSLQIVQDWTSLNFTQPKMGGPVATGGSTILQIWVKFPATSTFRAIQMIVQSGGFAQTDTGPTTNPAAGVWTLYQFTPTVMPASLDSVLLTLTCVAPANAPVLLDSFGRL